MKKAMVASLALILAPCGCDGTAECTCGDTVPCACTQHLCDTSVIGNICTIAGSGEQGYDADADVKALPALEAKLSLPQDTLTAPDGTLYIVDWENHRIRKLDADGKLHWVAGNAEPGGIVDDPDDPSEGDFRLPTSILFDSSGQNLLIAAWATSKVRTLDLATGVVSDTCGDGKRAYYGDEGPALTASLDLPSCIVFDPQGHLVIMDQGNQVIRWIDESGIIHRLAGQCIIDTAGSGPGLCAPGVAPLDCPDGPNGHSGKHACNDVAACTSWPCTWAYAGDGGPGVRMRMGQPTTSAATPSGRIEFDGRGALYFADTGNCLIRMIDAGGVVHRVAGEPPVDGRDTGGQRCGYSGDGGPALDATLNWPVDLAFGDDGTLYFTDVFNHCVRAIDPDGIITTVAGQCGRHGMSGDGGPATQARLTLPSGVEWANGRLNIADTGNNVIRSVRLR